MPVVPGVLFRVLMAVRAVGLGCIDGSDGSHPTVEVFFLGDGLKVFGVNAVPSPTEVV